MYQLWVLIGSFNYSTKFRLADKIGFDIITSKTILKTVGKKNNCNHLSEIVAIVSQNGAINWELRILTAY